jgi:hypothetical protein
MGKLRTREREREREICMLGWVGKNVIDGEYGKCIQVKYLAFLNKFRRLPMLWIVRFQVKKKLPSCLV